MFVYIKSKHHVAIKSFLQQQDQQFCVREKITQLLQGRTAVHSGVGQVDQVGGLAEGIMGNAIR